MKSVKEKKKEENYVKKIKKKISKIENKDEIII